MTDVLHGASRVPAGSTISGPAASSASASLAAGSELSSLLMAAETEHELYSRVSNWVCTRPGVAAAGCHRLENGTPSPIGHNQFSGPAFENEAFRQTAEKSATDACHGNAVSESAQNIRNIIVASLPIGRRDNQFDSLTAAVVNSPEGLSGEINSLTIAAALASRWHAEKAVSTGQHHLAMTAATLELLNTVESADNFRSATITLVNALRNHFSCRAIVLGLVAKNQGPCKVSAVSGLADFDQNADFTQRLQDCLEESIVRDRVSVFPAIDPNNRDTLLAHQAVLKLTSAGRITSHVLKNSAGDVVGAWMAIEDKHGEYSRDVPVLLRAAAPKLGDAIQLAQRADSGIFGGRGKRQKSAHWLGRGLLAVGVFALLMLIPVPYSVHCECSAEPKMRRFIVAPHAGLIEKTFVEPGDSVQRGTLLARMDGRDVRWELAGLSAKLEQASKQHDSGLLSGEVAAAQQAGLEVRRLEARRQILNRQIQQLEVKSPVDGIVLEGHLVRVENAPVTTGEALFEVAPLSPITVEVAVSDDEFSNVNVGSPASIHFDGLTADFEGIIRHVHSRSEVRNGDNVFIAEVTLENPDEQLRPGMSGYARVTGESRALGWNLFHKPWEHFCKSLPF